MIGESLKEHVKYRSTARPGDIICVTGDLGDSGGGLRLILEKKPVADKEALLIKRHHCPRAHLQEGAWLGNQEGVHAMIDISDGIDSDIQRIMERSRCGARIDLNRLPYSVELREVCSEYDWDVHEIAATGGEDYCLLCTVDAPAYEAINRDFSEKFGRDLFPIGQICEETKLDYRENGLPVHLTKHGFDHFV